MYYAIAKTFISLIQRTKNNGEFVWFKEILFESKKLFSGFFVLFTVKLHIILLLFEVAILLSMASVLENIKNLEYFFIFAFAYFIRNVLQTVISLLDV